MSYDIHTYHPPPVDQTTIVRLITSFSTILYSACQVRSTQLWYSNFSCLLLSLFFVTSLFFSWAFWRFIHGPAAVGVNGHHFPGPILVVNIFAERVSDWLSRERSPRDKLRLEGGGYCRYLDTNYSYLGTFLCLGWLMCLFKELLARIGQVHHTLTSSWIGPATLLFYLGLAS